MTRLPVYQRILEELLRSGTTTVSSELLASAAQVNAAKVRKDLSLLGSFGTRGAGYDAAFLIEQIDRQLGLDRVWPVVIAGIGNLGRALARSQGFAARNFDVTALLDTDPAIIGELVDDVVVRHVDDLPRIASERPLSIGVITTPPSVAQRVADMMIAAGIRSILNFAPRVLEVPPHVLLRYVDLSIELQVMSFYQSRMADAPTDNRMPVIRSVGLTYQPVGVTLGVSARLRPTTGRRPSGPRRVAWPRGSAMRGVRRLKCGTRPLPPYAWGWTWARTDHPGRGCEPVVHPDEGRPMSSVRKEAVARVGDRRRPRAAPVPPRSSRAGGGARAASCPRRSAGCGTSPTSPRSSSSRPASAPRSTPWSSGSTTAWPSCTEFLATISGSPVDSLTEHLTVRFDDDVTSHLFAVAAGLDSAVLGESEVLGQVRRAWERARERAGVGSGARGAVPSCRRDRQAGPVGDGHRPRDHLAVPRGGGSGRPPPDQGLDGARVLVVGAGEMGEGVTQALDAADDGRSGGGQPHRRPDRVRGRRSSAPTPPAG